MIAISGFIHSVVLSGYLMPAKLSSLELKTNRWVSNALSGSIISSVDFLVDRHVLVPVFKSIL